MITESKNKKQTKAEEAAEKKEAARKHKKVLQDRYGIGKKPTHYRGKS
jgi:hypothetical protein